MTTQPIRSKNHIKQISEYFLNKGELRNLLLFIMGIHTALRISDMLRLTWNDAYDFANNRIRREFSIVEKKTGKSKIIAVNHAVIGAVAQLFKQASPAPDDFLFAHPHRNKAISRIQAYRIILFVDRQMNILSRNGYFQHLGALRLKYKASLTLNNE